MNPEVKPETEKVRQAVQKLGGQTNTARLLGVTVPTVHEWVKGVRRVPDRHCPTLERLTDGLVICEDIRPDIDWAFVRGRPVKRSAQA